LHGNGREEHEQGFQQVLIGLEIHFSYVQLDLLER
jgi:hypothetical protein